MHASSADLGVSPIELQKRLAKGRQEQCHRASPKIASKASRILEAAARDGGGAITSLLIGGWMERRVHGLARYAVDWQQALDPLGWLPGVQLLSDPLAVLAVD